MDADALEFAKRPRQRHGQPVPDGVRLATFRGWDADDRFLVQADGSIDAAPAMSTIALRDDDLGCRVVVAFEGGDERCPVILGRLQARPRPGGRKLLLEAEREIELRCGDASIVLTSAGKVLIKGAYVSSRSRGANRIKGAYVDIN